MLSPDARRALSNVALKGSSLPVEKAFRVLLVAVSARLLGQAAFGRYTYASTLTAFVVFFTDLGVGTWTTRAVAREGNRRRVIAGSTLVVRLLTAIPCAVGLGVLMLRAPAGELRVVIAALGVASFAGAFVDHVGSIFRGYERLGDEAKLNTFTAGCAALAGLAALGRFGGVPALAAGVAVGTLGGAGYGAWLLRRRYGIPGGGVDWRLIRRMPAQTLPLWLAALLSAVYFKSDVLWVRRFAGDAETGAYGVAFKLFEATTIAPSLLLAALFPQLARAANDPSRRAQLERKVAGLLLAVGVAAGTFVAASGAIVIEKVFGATFARSVAMLKILALTVPLLFLNAALTSALVARDMGRAYVGFAAGLVAVNAGANLALVPGLGGAGAAWAKLVTESVLSVCCVATLLRAQRRDRGGP